MDNARDADGNRDGERDAGRDRNAGRGEHLAAWTLLLPASSSRVKPVLGAASGTLTRASCHAVPKLLRLVPMPHGCCAESQSLRLSTWVVAAL